MTRSRNLLLAEWMADHKITVRELAHQVNEAIRSFTGRTGTVSDMTVYRWLRAEHTWPNERQRLALQRVTGRTAVQLGFRPRGKTSAIPSSLEEDPVYRRAFLTAATAAGISLTTPAAADQRPRRLGSADVDEFQAQLAAWTSVESLYGGTPALEQKAASLADQAIALQQSNSGSARIRSELYTVAAAFSNSAMWAAIDGRRYDNALRHMHQTVTLAGLSGDSGTQFRVWSHAGMLFRHLNRPADAMAAAEASRATAITRRDPLYASLSLARLAIQHADAGDARNTLRYLALAQEALNRADLTLRRPSWIDFYDQAELDDLAMVAHLRLGLWANAEQHAHRSLSFLRPDMKRNRALIQADLATAQLMQDDVELAVASARSVPAEMMRHSRTRTKLDDLTQRLTERAPRNQEVLAWQSLYQSAVA